MLPKSIQICKNNLQIVRYVSSKFPTTDIAADLGDNAPPPSNAKVVICGGGVMGAAVAYHLAEKGWGSETTIIEKVLF